MFKAGPDSNRLSLQRGRAVWFLLQDSSGGSEGQRRRQLGDWQRRSFPGGAVFDNMSSDLWHQRLQGRGGEAADVVCPSVKCVCVCVCPFWQRAMSPGVLNGTQYLQTQIEALGDPSVVRDKWNFKENGSLCFFVPCFLYWILIIPCCHFLSFFIFGFRQSKHTEITSERNRHSPWFRSEPSEQWVDFNIDAHTHARPITALFRCRTQIFPLLWK